MKYKLFIFYFSFLSFTMSAQDLHHSLFHLIPSFYNIASTNNFDDQWRCGLVYRNQWASVPLPYTTLTAVFDKKIGRNINPGGWATSFIFHYDKAGDTHLNWIELAANVSYGVRLGSSSVLSAGFQLGGVQRAFSTSGLSFDKQFIDDHYDPINPNGENLANKQKLGIDLGAGVSYLQKISKNIVFNIGASVRHLNQANINFFDEKTKKMPLRFNYQSSLNLGLTNNIELQLNGLYSTQEVQNELVAGGLIRYFLHSESMEGTSFGLGFYLRNQDAYIPFVELKWDAWLLSVSYDINNSKFVEATNRKGGPEIALFYAPKPKIKFNTFKPCPIF